MVITFLLVFLHPIVSHRLINIGEWSIHSITSDPVSRWNSFLTKREARISTILIRVLGIILEKLFRFVIREIINLLWRVQTNVNRKVVKGNLNSIWFVEIYRKKTRMPFFERLCLLERNGRFPLLFEEEEKKRTHANLKYVASIVCPRYVIITFGVRRFVTDCDLCDNKCPDFTANWSINSTLLPLPGFPLLTGHKGRWVRGKYEEWWIHHAVLSPFVHRCVYISQVRMYRQSFIIYLCWM